MDLFEELDLDNISYKEQAVPEGIDILLEG
jgi:hypothetical protein